MRICRLDIFYQPFEFWQINNNYCKVSASCHASSQYQLSLCWIFNESKDMFSFAIIAWHREAQLAEMMPRRKALLVHVVSAKGPLHGWPGDTRSQNSSHDIDLVLLKYSNLSTRWVKGSLIFYWYIDLLINTCDLLVIMQYRCTFLLLLRNWNQILPLPGFLWKRYTIQNTSAKEAIMSETSVNTMHPISLYLTVLSNEKYYTCNVCHSKWPCSYDLRKYFKGTVS